MATADDGPGGLEKRLIERAENRSGFHLDPAAVILLREAAIALGECRRAMEASRVWWDDTDPYHAEWNHSSTCWPGHECGACVARRLAMETLAKLGEGG